MPKISMEEFIEFEESTRKPYFEPIGKFVFEFGFLEKHVDEAVQKLLEVSDHIKDAATKPIQSLQAKVGLYYALVQRQTTKDDTEFRDEAVELAKALNGLREFRNDLVHGPWTAFFINHPEGASTWQKFKTTNSYQARAFNVTVAEIEDHTANAAKIGVRLVQLANRIIEKKNSRPTRG